MKTQIRLLVLAATLVALPCLLPAQSPPPSFTPHYVPGVEGIKGATLPPPGVYVRDYNVFYFADRANDSSGNKVVDPGVFVYANVPRVLWITDQKVLGGNLGVDALVPLQYTKVDVLNDSTFGVGDLFAEGTLSWHEAKYDAALAYGVWAPTGDSSPGPTTRAGLGFWTHMFTAGLTWYLDQGKKWAVSALNRYEINHEKDDTDITPGQAYTLEWGLSYATTKTVDVGVAGYYQCQTTKDRGTGASSSKDQVVAVGPEIVAFCPKLGVFASLRYNYEIMSEDRTQGHTVALTLTKRF